MSLQKLKLTYFTITIQYLFYKNILLVLQARLSIQFEEVTLSAMILLIYLLDPQHAPLQ
jgi:hypothetical protein